MRRKIVSLAVGSPAALLALLVLASPPAAAGQERGMAQQSAAPAPAPAPYVAPAPPPPPPPMMAAPAAEPYVARSAPSFEPAPARSGPSHDTPASPTTVSTHRSAPPRSGGTVGHADPRRGREPSARPGQGSGRTWGSTGPRGPGWDRGYRPTRHYHRPTWGWGGTSWWWGGPWDWWWWGPGWGWGPYWGWGGVVVIENTDPRPNRFARIDTDVSPETAEVYLDGTYVGSADDFDGWPDYLYLEPGAYRLEFRHPGYETLVKELTVRAGQRIDLTDDMKLLPGQSRLTAKDPENRGTPLGRVFGKPNDEDRGRGDRTGRWEPRDRPDRARPVDMDDPDEIDEPDEDVAPPPPRAPRTDVRKSRGEAEEVAPAERGRFRFEVKPADAAVWLDDKYVGTAEELAGLARGLSVTPGKRSVTVVRPGYATKTVDVEAKPGSAIDVVVELEKN